MILIELFNTEKQNQIYSQLGYIEENVSKNSLPINHWVVSINHEHRTLLSLIELVTREKLRKTLNIQNSFNYHEWETSIRNRWIFIGTKKQRSSSPILSVYEIGKTKLKVCKFNLRALTKPKNTSQNIQTVTKRNYKEKFVKMLFFSWEEEALMSTKNHKYIVGTEMNL